MSEHFEPIGQRFLDANSGKEMILVTEGNAEGWVCYRHPDGQWVTHRLAMDDDRKAIELTTLRERVRELEEKNAHSLEGMHKLGDLVNEGVARIRELEEAMPHPFTLREIAKGINNECYATGLDAPTLEMMADRIEKVMTKQPSKK